MGLSLSSCLFLVGCGSGSSGSQPSPSEQCGGPQKQVTINMTGSVPACALENNAQGENPLSFGVEYYCDGSAGGYQELANSTNQASTLRGSQGSITMNEGHTKLKSVTPPQTTVTCDLTGNRYKVTFTDANGKAVKSGDPINTENPTYTLNFTSLNTSKTAHFTNDKSAMESLSSKNKNNTFDEGQFSK